MICPRLQYRLLSLGYICLGCCWFVCHLYFHLCLPLYLRFCLFLNLCYTICLYLQQRLLGFYLSRLMLTCMPFVFSLVFVFVFYLFLCLYTSCLYLLQKTLWILFVSVNVDSCPLSVWGHCGHNSLWILLFAKHNFEFHCFCCTDLYFADLHRFVFGCVAFLCFVSVLTFYVSHLSARYSGPHLLQDCNVTNDDDDSSFMNIIYNHNHHHQHDHHDHCITDL